MMDGKTETCRVLFQNKIWEIGAPSWFYYRNISDSVVEKINTYVLCSGIPPSPENRAVYEIMWKMWCLDRPQMTVWHMRIACWIAKARIQTCTRSIRTATVVTRTHISITLYVHWLACKVLILVTRSVKEYLVGNFGSRRKVWKPPI
jgi:hypothetical protein